jgi:hypothetical protein
LVDAITAFVIKLEVDHQTVLTREACFPQSGVEQISPTTGWNLLQLGQVFWLPSS